MKILFSSEQDGIDVEIEFDVDTGSICIDGRRSYFEFRLMRLVACLMDFYEILKKEK